MTPWTSFYDLIAPDLPGCSFAAMDVALRQSAIAFCEQSLAWKYTHPDVAIVAATASYAFVPPSQAVVHAITYAALNDTEISCNAGEVALAMNLYDWRHATGTPLYVMGAPIWLQLVPEPDASGTLSMEVALKPSPSGTGIDDTVFNEYREAIIHGALGRLMLSPKKPYTSVPLAQYHGQQFQIMTGQAGMRQARNFTRAPLQTAILRRGQ